MEMSRRQAAHHAFWVLFAIACFGIAFCIFLVESGETSLATMLKPTLDYTTVGTIIFVIIMACCFCIAYPRLVALLLCESVTAIIAFIVIFAVTAGLPGRPGLNPMVLALNAVISVAITIWIWRQKPDERPYSNHSK